MKSKYPDWLIRTAKTFVQSFFGPIILEFAAILMKGFPESWNALWLLLVPTISASLSSTICAIWNIIREKLEEGVPNAD